MPRTQPATRRRQLGPSALAGALLAFAAACSTYQPFDPETHLRGQVTERVGAELSEAVDFPFELTPELVAAVEERLSPAGSERRRTEQVIDFIFGWVDLRYALTPTRDAAGTYAAREGNCLSFVNLFVGVARHQRLNPFYVEVRDYQRWNYREGVVVSRGHIVAGLYVDGKLETFDFLPYRPKSYKQFKPIEDLAATAHFYNNLGAEALMEDRLAAAREHLEIAVSLAPDFDKAINNMGVALLRGGDTARAIELFERGRALHPEDVPILTNLARAYQETGRVDEAGEVLARIEDVNESNPFFFVYRGDLALARGDSTQALRYMREALRADSEVPEVHVGLARVYMAIGELAKARHHVERALKLDATHDEARKFAALLNRGQGGTG